MCNWGETRILPINGKERDVDSCIAHLVATLNSGGFKTIASCCGHGKQPSTIVFEMNGEVKEMRIMTFEQARIVDGMFPELSAAIEQAKKEQK